MDKQLIVNAQCLRVKLVSCILILHKSDFYFLDGWKLSPTESGFWCEHSFLEVNIAFVRDVFHFKLFLWQNSSVWELSDPIRKAVQAAVSKRCSYLGGSEMAVYHQIFVLVFTASLAVLWCSVSLLRAKLEWHQLGTDQMLGQRPHICECRKRSGEG